MNKISDHLFPSIEITTVMGCRVNCKYCPQKELLSKYFSKNDKRISFMSLDIFKKCINKMPQNTTIVFSGAAEPMLNPDVYDMILYADSKKMKIRLFTTLEGMTLEGYEKIKDVQFQSVILHAPDIDNYAKIEMSEMYFQILGRMMNKSKQNGNRFIDYCNCQGEFHPDFLKHVIGEIPGINKKTELHDRAGNLENDANLTTKKNEGIIFCGGSFPILNHFLLFPDGTVCLCCMDFGMDHILGNLLHNTYKELRNSSEMKRVEYNMIFRKEKILCRNCSYSRSFSEIVKIIIKRNRI